MDFPPLSSFTPVSLEWRMVPRLAWIFCNLQVTVDSRNRSTLHKGGSVDTVSRTIAGTSPLKTRDSAIIRQDIGLYLKGSASTWWTMELDDVTMTSLCQSFLSACTHIHSRFQLVVPSQERLSAYATSCEDGVLVKTNDKEPTNNVGFMYRYLNLPTFLVTGRIWIPVPSSTFSKVCTKPTRDKHII
ncbi:hypothetical protein GX50_01870 [[Emmonsia] crescens]|uniref:Uncharacterized protein n=1 Tax=[Emmonsia] crescens TaxID=73230 RepID=A0A2B7ZPS0_9EURO|nr:hypothetical protein GX50_01870 [Emmonsia crescens]